MIQRRTRIASLLIAAACLLSVVAVVTFAWFQKNYRMGGLNVNTGSIGLTLSTYAYNDGATTLIGSTSDPDNGEAPVTGSEHTFKKIETGKPAIFFVKLEKQADSEDVSYGFKLYLEGLMQSSKDYEKAIEYAGGFWYDITEVQLNLTAPTPDSSAVESEASELAALTQIAQDTDSPANAEGYSALSGIDTDVRIDKLTDTVSVKYYRVLIGKYNSASTVDYSERELKMHAVVSASQGDQATMDGTQTWVVNNKAELLDALTQYMPGDTIKIVGELTLDRDLIFNRPVNLYINDKSRLTVEGNFIMNFNSSEDCVIDTTGAGQLVVIRRKGTNAGGNMQIVTPSSKITFNGSNSLMLGRGDVYVERLITFGAAYNKGVVVKNSNIYATGTDENGNACVNTNANIYKYIYLSNGGYLRVEKGTTVGQVFAASGDVKYVGIYNNGTIAKIDLGDMTQDTTITGMPQIYINNNGIITDNYIVLPASWPKKYVIDGGSDNGNTRIRQDISGYPMTVGIKRSDPQYADYQGFADEDIEHVDPEDLVVSNNDNGTNLTVYYYDVEDSNGVVNSTTIQKLLEDFFAAEENAAMYPNGVSDGYATVTALTVITQANKFITYTDYTYFRSYTQLEALDLSNSYTERVYVEVLVGGSAAQPETEAGTYAALPKNVFSGMTKLSKVLLPENTEIVRYQFAPGTAVRNVYLPSTVFACEIEHMYTGKNDTRTNAKCAFPTAYYVFCENRADLVKGLGDKGGISTDNVNQGTYPVYSVYDAFVAQLELKYSNSIQWYSYSDEWRKRVVPTAELGYEEYTVDGFTKRAEYLVHSLGNDEWEIVYYRSDDGRKPANIGSGIKSADGQKIYNITAVGDNALSGVYKDSGTAIDVSFADSVTELGRFSFGTYNVNNKISSINLNKVENIGYAAFAYVDIDDGVVFGDKVTKLDSYAFYNCRTLTDVRFSACSSIGSYAFHDCQKLVTASLQNATTVNDAAFNVTSVATSAHSLRLVTLGTPEYWGTNIFVNKNLTAGQYTRLLVNINGSTPLADPSQYTGSTVTQDNFVAVVKSNVYNSYGTKPFTKNAVIISDDCWSLDDVVINFGTDVVPLYLATSECFEGSTAPIFAYSRTTASTDYSSGDGSVVVTASTTGAMLVHSWAWDIDLHDYSVPAKVRFVRDGVTVQEDLVAIGEYAFKNTTIVNADSTHIFKLPDSVKLISANAFNNCEFDATVAEADRIFDMGQGVELVASYGVSGTNFQRIIFSVSLHTAKEYAFTQNHSLAVIAEEDWNGNAKPVYFEKYSFYNNDGLTSAYLPDAAVELGSYAFAGCEYLQSVTGVGIKTIQPYCFNGCSSLDFADLRSLSTFGDNYGTGTQDGYFFQNIDSHLKLLRFGVIETGYSKYAFTGSENGGVILLGGMPVKQPVGNSLLGDNNCFTNGIVIGEKGSKAFYNTYVNRSNSFAELHEGITANDVVFYTTAAGRQWLYAVNNKADSIADGIYIVYCYARQLSPSELNADLADIKAAVNQELGLSGENELEVVSIGERCFQFTKLSGRVDLSDTGIIDICSNAFYGTAVSEIILPDTAITLYDYAFSELSSLEKVSGDNVKTIGAYAFAKCLALSDVTLPNATTVGNYAFQNCSSLTELVLNEAHTIGTRAFNGCLALESFSANKVTEIGESAFEGINSLTYLNLPALQEVKNKAFNNCDGLTEFIAENLQTVRANAFSDCAKLTRVYIPSAINFYSNAFSSCTYLAELTVGPISYLEKANWLNTTRGGALIIEGNGAQISPLIFDNLNHFSGGYAFVGSEAYAQYGSGKFDGRAIVLNNIETTTYDAYKELAYKTVTINGIELPKYLYTVTDDTVTVSVCNLFNGTADVIPEDLYDILEKENANNAAVVKMVINGSFCFNKKLTGDLDFSNWNSGTDGFILRNINSNAFRSCGTVSSISLPNSLTSITGGTVFNGCGSLVSFSAPALKNISGAEFFTDCTKLSNVSMPNLTTAAGSAIFRRCSSLVKLELPSLTTIGNYWMQGCDSLTYFSAPNMATIPVGMFEDCKNVAYVCLKGTNSSATDGDFDFAVSSNVNTIILFTGVAQRNNFVDRLNNSACTSVGVMQNGSVTGNATFVNTLASGFDVSNAKAYGTYELKGVNVGKYYYVKSNDGTALQLLFCMQKQLTVEELVEDLAAIEAREGARFTDIGKMALRFTTLTGDIFEIPEKVERIGDYAFNNVENRGSLNTVKFENAMKSIGKLAFDGTAKRVIINVTEASTHGNASTHRIDVTSDSVGKLFASDAVLYVGGVGKPYYDGSNWAGLGTPNTYGYELIGANGEQFFFGDDPDNEGGVVLKSMLLPSNWSSSTLTIPSTVTTPAGVMNVTGFDKEAFLNVKSLTAVKTLVLPDHMAANAFAKYDYTMYFVNLQAFSASSSSDNFSTSNGVLFSKDGKTLWAYPTAKSGTSYTVPATVNRIGVTAFVGVQYLEDVYYGTNP